MKNHSNLLNTFKLALVCGATLLPLSEANAGWNKMVDALQDTTPEALAPLKALRDRKLKESPRDPNWAYRSRQIRTHETAPIKTVEGLKKHLRHVVEKTRNGTLISRNGKQDDAVLAVADGEGRKDAGVV